MGAIVVETVDGEREVLHTFDTGDENLAFSIYNLFKSHKDESPRFIERDNNE